MSTLLLTAADPRTQARNRWLWTVLAGLALAQLFAFWLLCSHQVRKAEARQHQTLVQQMARSDCLQFIPGSTIASCTLAVEVAQPALPPTGPTGAVPVSFSYR